MKLKYIAIVPLFFLLVHCKSKQQKTKDSQATKTLVDGNYKVTEIKGEKISNEKVHFSIDLDKNRISGNGGCNTFNASFEHNHDDVEIGMPMATKMACRDAQKTEQQFFNALKAVKKYKFDGSVLQLTSEGGKSLITATKKE